eukprot:scaffold133339_cov52-Phaeocystis_antarctica.AAC.3
MDDEEVVAGRWHLDGRAGRVPEGAGDSEVPRDVGRLEEGRRPRPLRHDDLRGVPGGGGGQAEPSGSGSGSGSGPVSGPGGRC